MKGVTKNAKGFVKRGGYVLPENVPFKQMLPLKQRNLVSSKGKTSTAPACVQEMSILFACLKTNDFNDIQCSKEVENFKKCYDQQSAAKKSQKEQERRGVLQPGEKKLSHGQVNQLLKLYPVRDY